MVQYPPPGSFKPIEGKRKEKSPRNENVENGKDDNLVLNKKSEVLALALGVQIKTGEDPPTGEISISGYDKKKKLREKFLNSEDDPKKAGDLLSKLHFGAPKGPKSEVHLKQIPDNLNEQVKPSQNNAHREQHDFKRVVGRDGHHRRDVRRRSLDRRPNRYRPYDRYRRSRSRHRSGRRSRDRRSRSRTRNRPKSPRKSPVKKRSRSKEDDKERSRRRTTTESSKEGDRDKKEETKKVETNAEKMKRRAEQLLLLKKKMELELMEKQRKEAEEKRREQEVNIGEDVGFESVVIGSRVGVRK